MKTILMLGLFLSSLLLASNLSRTFAEHNFVTIPAGSLPFINQKFVPSFEAAEGPVTRELWEATVGHLPSALQAKITQGELNSCPDCPVTHMDLEKKLEGFLLWKKTEIDYFLEQLNEHMSFTGCVYQMTTSNQMCHMFKLGYGSRQGNSWFLSRDAADTITDVIDLRTLTRLHDWYYGIYYAETGGLGHVYLSERKPKSNGIWLTRKCFGYRGTDLGSGLSSQKN